MLNGVDFVNGCSGSTTVARRRVRPVTLYVNGDAEEMDTECEVRTGIRGHDPNCMRVVATA
jgi:hypothetical protein